MAAAFPPLEWSGLAWLALVPLLLAVRGAEPGRAFRLGWLAGFVFWLCSTHWLTHVSAAGWIGLAAYCALYPGWFALAAAGGWTLSARARPGRLLFPALAALVWTGLEWLRGTLFTGFAWNPLGVSQYRNLPLIHIAAWGGVGAVSALVALVNVALALTVQNYRAAWAARTRASRTELMLALLLVALAWAGGVRALRAPPVPVTLLRVALIQPNIPQADKWTPENFDLIYDRLRTETRRALAAGPLDLIVWPETALPDDVRTSTNSYAVVRDLVTNGTPIFLGSMDTEWRDNQPVYYNSSFLFDTQGRLAQSYDKRHLVIFGEYVPLQGLLPFIALLTPIEASFTPGAISTVFRLDQPPVAFAALICFEDTVAPLAREAVQRGARLLINQSNDAWFDPSGASRQHMTHSVLRAVENGVPILRSCNTGVSCCIDRFGQVYDVLADRDGRVAVTGFRTSVVAVPGDTMPLTFYTRHGELLGPCGAGLAVCGLALAFWRARRKDDGVLIHRLKLE
ncbi:MAG: apolipoprotein N-acyltransferase [Kiritimatiellaeota bacterium]|nr:apolipoprotein N-acyltransferase [Kiritimatiellota bacterium]